MLDEWGLKARSDSDWPRRAPQDKVSVWGHVPGCKSGGVPGGQERGEKNLPSSIKSTQAGL